MSRFGKWNLGIGVGLVVVAVLCRALEQIPATVITAILGLLTIGIAGYDALYYWLERGNQRRQAARYQRERDGR